MQRMPLIRAVRMFTLAAIAALLTGSAIAQVETGRFVGRIVDAQDATVVGAAIKVTNTGTSIEQTAITNGSGEFVITPVSAGVYVLSVTAPGFETGS